MMRLFVNIENGDLVSLDDIKKQWNESPSYFREEYGNEFGHYLSACMEHNDGVLREMRVME